MAIEFAFLALPFFLVLFAIMEVALILLASIQMEDATDRMSRRAMIDAGMRNESAIRKGVCDLVVLPINCNALRIDYREFLSVDTFTLRSATKDGKYDPSAFGFQTTPSAAFASLRVGYEWPITIKPLAQFFGSSGDGKTFLLGSSIMRIER